MLFSENINHFVTVHGRYSQTNRRDCYGNSTLCTKVHRAVKTERRKLEIAVAQSCLVVSASHRRAPFYCFEKSRVTWPRN